VREAEAYFGKAVDFYVDGGDLSGHLPSTILKIVDDAVEVVREGAVKIDDSGRMQ
jgi:tRNA A37 threonylcarbamoyladenosine synthetase subunit TsaC/SUA5/YrdC